MKVAAITARHGCPHCCAFSISASLHLHQQSLVLRSPGQPTALTHADPVWSIFFLLPWASFLLHGMQLSYISHENCLMYNKAEKF